MNKVRQEGEDLNGTVLEYTQYILDLSKEAGEAEKTKGEFKSFLTQANTNAGLPSNNDNMNLLLSTITKLNDDNLKLRLAAVDVKQDLEVLKEYQRNFQGAVSKLTGTSNEINALKTHYGN